jgi:hypothetical protein
VEYAQHGRAGDKNHSNEDTFHFEAPPIDAWIKQLRRCLSYEQGLSRVPEKITFN